MKYILILFCFLNSTCSFGLEADSTKQTDINSNRSNSNSSPVEIQLKLPNTLQVENVTQKKDDRSWFEKYFPAIVVLVIGIVSALVNLLIGRNIQRSNERTRISNEKNLLKQIESTEQLEMVKFKATINTQNRQAWIDQLRHELSELISKGISIAFQIQSPEFKEFDMKEDFVQLRYSYAKIEMLLNDNDDKPEQLELLRLVSLVYDTHAAGSDNFDQEKATNARDKMIKAARKLFGIHWDKIKNLE